MFSSSHLTPNWFYNNDFFYSWKKINFNIIFSKITNLESLWHLKQKQAKHQWKIDKDSNSDKLTWKTWTVYSHYFILSNFWSKTGLQSFKKGKLPAECVERRLLLLPKISSTIHIKLLQCLQCKQQQQQVQNMTSWCPSVNIMTRIKTSLYFWMYNAVKS